jgi:uncharacterized DUF497 family protein
MEFDWDPDKAERNLRKHGVSFPEAATVFGDTLSWTYPDDAKSEQRWIIIGMSEQRRILVVCHLEEEVAIRIISAREATRQERRAMKKDEIQDDMLPEYDFKNMSGGVRGKYAAAYRQGTNLVRLDPDVAKAFTTEASVNEALRAVLMAAAAIPARKARARSTHR